MMKMSKGGTMEGEQGRDGNFKGGKIRPELDVRKCLGFLE